jgi:cell division septation protein DedD
MDKLRLWWLVGCVAGLIASLIAQPMPDKGNVAESPEARITVARVDTKAPIAGAILTNRQGQTLGFTDATGSLRVGLPATAREELTVRAEGYRIKSLPVERNGGVPETYEIYLDPVTAIQQEGVRETVDLMPASEPSESVDLVKVYVRQDPGAMLTQQDPAKKPAVVFAVQLSATSRPVADASAFKSWESVGPVFIHQEEGLYKVRIGPYASQQEAKAALLKVKEKGKMDAFIVVQQGREENQITDRKPAQLAAQAQPADAPATTTAPASAADEPFALEEGAEYKVRLASYLKPGGFSTREIEQYGTFETYRQGEWTIMLIGGLKSKEEAERVRAAVAAKGFPDARVVIDRGGVLEDAPKQ